MENTNTNMNCDIKGLCPMHENCGGCIYQGTPYEE